MIALRHSPPSVEELMQWSDDNPGYRFEYVNGEVTIVSPMTPASGRRTSALNAKLWMWAQANGYVSFGSSTLFQFGGLTVSPDEVLVRAEIFDALTPEEQDQIGDLIPEIAVEIVSKSQGQGKERRGVLPKCKAMHEARVGYVLILDPYAVGDERVTEWGVAPPNFPTDWDNVLNA
jgi:Uma2 family endonuclease